MARTEPNLILTKHHVRRAAQNNLPDQHTVEMTQAIIKCVQALERSDICICLISGGGSALLCEPTVPLPDMLDTIKILVSHSATIHQLNTVRKYLCKVKGGGLTRYIAADNVISLVISDVIRDDLHTIASGPTYPHRVSRSDVIDVLDKLKISVTSLPRSVSDLLDTALDNITSDEISPSFCRNYSYQNMTCNHISINQQNIYNFIIGSNKLALQSALQEVQREGYTGVVLTDAISGEARDIGEDLVQLAESMISKEDRRYHILSQDIVAIAKSSFQQHEDMCFILGGETTVTINGTGIGGRCQELSLSAGVQLHMLQDHIGAKYQVSVLATSTDGQDGPTDSCGAYVTQTTYTEAVTQHLDMQAHLLNNDSHSFFSKLNCAGNLLKTGMTGTNVMDIVFLFIKRVL